MLSAAGLLRGIFRAGFVRLTEAAFAEELSFGRRALAFHLWQSRAEDEWDHPHDEHSPEDLADRIHHITITTSEADYVVSMPKSRTDFMRFAVFVKVVSKLFWSLPEIPGM